MRIIGGLGNQMFQYALGRRLSLAHGVELRLDVSGFETYTLQDLGLQHLALSLEAAPAGVVRELTVMAPRFPENLVRRKHLPRFLRRSRRYHPLHRREVEGFRFEPSILETPAHLYLDGYWQSERYFETIEEQLREDFTIRTPLAGRNAEVAEQIAGAEAVSLHVRRGDYATDAKTLATHGLCPLEYYEAAKEEVGRRLGNPRFFVFSDDPSWAAENLKLPSETVFVDHNDAETNYEDLRLMSLCRHHIIANSSFSWWGAWLNPAREKIVIAPRRWMADPTVECPDICPANWARL